MKLLSRSLVVAVVASLVLAFPAGPNGESSSKAETVSSFTMSYLGDGQVRVSAESGNPFVNEQQYALISVNGQPDKSCLLRDDRGSCEIAGLERGLSYTFSALIQCTVGPNESPDCFNQVGQEPLSIAEAVSVPRADSNSRQPRPRSKCRTNGSQVSNSSFIWTCVRRKWQRRPVVHGKRVDIPNYPVFEPTSADAVARPSQSAGVANVNECKIADARDSQQGDPSNVGFPLSQDLIPVAGTARFLGIPIDFPDAEGTGEWLEEMRQQQRVMAQWFRFFSGGRLDVEFVTPDDWIRAPRPSAGYQTGTPAPNSYSPVTAQWDAFAQEFVDATGTTFNWDGIHGVFFHFPEQQNLGIPYEILGRGTALRTPQGTRNLFYWGDGQYQFRMAQTVPNYWAALWTHEALHSMGAALHAPGNGFLTGVGQNQGGLSWAFNAWEMFKAGWLGDDQVFCAPINRAGESTVNLRPLEVPGPGMKTVIVPLNDYQALVAESRRPVGYSRGWDPDESGVLVYLLDTRNGNDRSNEGSGADCGNNPEFPKWAYYLSSDQRPRSVTPPCSPQSEYSEYLLKPGESVTRDGVVITYDMDGEFDTISVRRPG